MKTCEEILSQVLIGDVTGMSMAINIQHFKKYLCTNTASPDTKPITHNAGALHLQLRNMSVITIQAPSELNIQHIYQLNTSDFLPSGLIRLAVDHRIHQKYPKLLSVPIHNTVNDTVHFQRTTVPGTLYPIDIKHI